MWIFFKIPLTKIILDLFQCSNILFPRFSEKKKQNQIYSVPISTITETRTKYKNCNIQVSIKTENKR